MANYKVRRNYTPHDLAGVVLKVGDHLVEGLESVEWELDEDETTIQKSADGMALFCKDPSRTGVVRIQILEPSASNDEFWTKRNDDETFTLTMTDPGAPNLSCRANYCRVSKPPIVKRMKEADTIEWVCIAAYMDIVGGSYTLETP